MISEEEEKKRKKEISKLLAEFPLYKSIELADFFPHNPDFLKDITFNFFCKDEGNIQTFSLSIVRDNIFAKAITERSSAHSGAYIAGQLLSFTAYCEGTCSSCRKYSVDFLLNAYSKKPKRESNGGVQDGKKQESIFLRKIGQLPAFEFKGDKEILNYLSEEDAKFYNKALLNISTSNGIGAFAYFRRIIENEIKRLVTDISTLSDNETEMAEAITKYEQNHQMNTLIDKLTGHLPSSFSSLGDNPIKLLYEQASIGIHSLSEEECLDKAMNIDTVLKFVVKQINSERTEMKSVKDAMKNLRK